MTQEFYESKITDVERAIASITVFKTQMKIFEKKFLSDRQYTARLNEVEATVNVSTGVFAKKL